MWTYEITSGRMFRPDGTLLGTGYAGGECGAVPEAVNNLDYVGARNIGPIPPGKYTMTELVAESTLGPNAIALQPDPANTMYGRYGFFIHADLVNAATRPHSASDGCIAGLSEAQRLEMWDSTNHEMQAVLAL